MAKQLDPEIVRVLKKHYPDMTDEEKADTCWLMERPGDRGGPAWIMKHKWVEKLGAAEGVELRSITWLSLHQAEGCAACQVVMSAPDGRIAITTGEASPQNSSSPYPFAVAEKRGIDRAILKLLGMHGDVYSDEELDKSVRRSQGPAVAVKRVEDLPGDDGPAFEEFWAAYGKKTGKPWCEKKWKSLSRATREQIMAHVPKYVQATPDKKFRKDPRTYLHNQGWTDELDFAPEKEELTRAQVLEEMQKLGTNMAKDYTLIHREDGTVRFVRNG